MTQASPRTRRPPARLVVSALAVLAGVLVAVFGFHGGGPRKLVPGAGPGNDPLAYEPAREPIFVKRAADGESQVLYLKSPGGVLATAARTARWRPLVEATARRYSIDPDTLEAIVFLESAGRPDARASNDLTGAAGLTQILAGTATQLLGMQVDLAASRSLTRRIGAAERRGRGRLAKRLLARRARVDQRFDPAKALAGTGRYLQIARSRFHRDDLAVESYHMGIGNLQGALAAYGGGSDTSYARLYFDSTPLRHADAYQRLARLGDDSATYLWRVLAAKEIMRLYRTDRPKLRRLATLHTHKATAEEVLHPLARTHVYESPRDIQRALADGTLRPLPRNASKLYLRIDPRMGELASLLHQPRSRYRALRPEALAVLVYIAAGVHGISDESPLTVTSTVRDTRYQRLLVARNIQATHAYSLHTTGFAFDILRSYRNRRQALAFQFMLDRLQALNVIAWAVEPEAIHITVSSDARRLEFLLERVR